MIRLSPLTWALSAALFCYGVVVFTFGPCLTAMAETFQVRLGQLGLIFTLYSVGLLPSILLNGYLSEVMGRRLILLTVILVMGFGCALFALVSGAGSPPSFVLALAVMVLIGVGGGGIEALTNILIADDNQAAPAFALNVSHAFFAIGAVVGPLGVSLLLRGGLPWRLLFYGAAGLFGALVLLLLPQRLPAASGEPFPAREALRLLRSRLVWVLLAMLGLYVGAEAGSSAWISPLLEKVLGAPRETAGLSVSLFWGMMIVGRLAISPVSTRLRPQPLLFGSALASALGVFGVAASRTAPACLIWTGVTGLSMSGIFALVLTDAAQHFREHLGAAFGVIIAGVGLGALTVPAIMGWVAEAAGLRAAMFVPAGLMVVVAASYLARWSR